MQSDTIIQAEKSDQRQAGSFHLSRAIASAACQVSLAPDASCDGWRVFARHMDYHEGPFLLPPGVAIAAEELAGAERREQAASSGQTLSHQEQRGRSEAKPSCPE